jgi:hypothetical protein
VLVGVRGPRALVAQSEPFNWPPTQPPEETEAARAAHDALVERLLATGWEPVDAAGAWYEWTFVPSAQPARRGPDGQS